MTALHDAELEAVGDGLAAGRSLPARWYADPDTLEREQELIFRRSWQYAGRADQVAEPGAFITVAAGPFPSRSSAAPTASSARSSTSAATAATTCSRAPGAAPRSSAPTTPGPTTSTARCARSRAARASPSASSACSRRSVAELGPFVFVHPEPDAPPFEEVIGDLPAVIASCGVDLERMAFRRRVPWTLEANWKIGVENYLECYHCPVAHPGLAKAIDVAPDSYRLETHPTFSVQKGVPRNPDEQPLDARRGDRPRAVALPLARTSPSTSSPGRRTSPSTPGSRTGRAGPWASRSTSSRRDVPEETADELMTFTRQVGREDGALVEAVQRGMASGAVPFGRLMPESEQLVAHFQRMVLAALRAA